MAYRQARNQNVCGNNWCRCMQMVCCSFDSLHFGGKREQLTSIHDHLNVVLNLVYI